MGSRMLLERALSIREETLGVEHLDTAATLHSLANVLNKQGDPKWARPLYERALSIREKMLGSDHPETAKTLTELAELLQTQAPP